MMIKSAVLAATSVRSHGRRRTRTRSRTRSRG
ncbi:hypothetical protein EV378_0240 [Pseudonocardia endophytica]|uniref:Uncharacterized protein n=1 Tax=Pseudonocardia endophytica TaxID=401976 RepID=A0A4R1HQR5_PSEEN|nr:hypothetical protein EV378_0240 [Pseudonocardia endophytica]